MATTPTYEMVPAVPAVALLSRKLGGGATAGTFLVRAGGTKSGSTTYPTTEKASGPAGIRTPALGLKRATTRRGFIERAHAASLPIAAFSGPSLDQMVAQC